MTAPRGLPSRSGSALAAAVGLARTFGAEVVDGRLRELAVDRIVPNPAQPRRRFEQAALERLAASIAARGVLQPVLVQPVEADRFALVAGERRWRAAQLVGLAEIPAFVRAGTDDATALELALTENTAREDLTVVEEARCLSALLDDLGVTQRVLAERVGRSRSDIANTVRLLELSDAALDLIETGALSKGHGKALLAVADVVLRDELAARAASGGWSVRQLELAIARSPRGTSRSAPDGREADLASLRALGERVQARSDSRVGISRQGANVTVSFTASDIDVLRGLLERAGA